MHLVESLHCRFVGLAVAAADRLGVVEQRIGITVHRKVVGGSRAVVIAEFQADHARFRQRIERAVAGLYPEIVLIAQVGLVPLLDEVVLLVVGVDADVSAVAHRVRTAKIHRHEVVAVVLIVFEIEDLFARGVGRRAVDFFVVVGLRDLHQPVAVRVDHLADGGCGLAPAFEIEQGFGLQHQRRIARGVSRLGDAFGQQGGRIGGFPGDEFPNVAFGRARLVEVVHVVLVEEGHGAVVTGQIRVAESPQEACFAAQMVVFPLLLSCKYCSHCSKYSC